MTEEGTSDPLGDIEWDEISPAECSSCNFAGTLKSFQQDQGRESAKELSRALSEILEEPETAIPAPLREAAILAINRAREILDVYEKKGVVTQPN